MTDVGDDCPEFRRTGNQQPTCEFSKDGKLLAVGRDAIRVFEVESGRTVWTYELDKWHDVEDLPEDHLSGWAEVSKISWSSDQTKLAYTSWKSPHIRILDLATGETSILGSGNNHNGLRIPSLAFAPGKNELATNGYDATVRLWSVPDGNPTHEFSVLRKWAKSPYYSPSGKFLAYCDLGHIYLWDAETKELIWMQSLPGVWKLAFSPDEGTIVCGGVGHEILVRAVNDDRERFILHGHRSSIIDVEVTPGGRLLSQAKVNSQVVDWGQLDQLSNRLEKHNGEIWSVSISPDQDFVASVCRDDGTVSVTEIETRKRVAEFSVSRKKVNHPAETAVDFLPTTEPGKLLLAALARNEVKLWRGPNESLRTLSPKLKSPTSELGALRFSPDSKWLVCGDSDGTLWYWDTATWAEHCWENCAVGWIHRIEIHSDGRIAVASSEVRRGPVSISCVRLEGQQVEFGPIDAKSTDWIDLAFQPGGDLLVSTAYRGVVNLWNAKTGNSVGEIDPLGTEVFSVAFTPNGNYLAIGSRTIKLWEMTDMVETISLGAGVYTNYRSLEFSRDGSFLVSGGVDDTVRIWKTK
ncbi:MAG: WD40 repeat domain-containing protein [Planctomycetaceae bacterium]|nr:WD40 repeat domain-containing protein [Planctomycetaceae bacterium]